MSRNLLHEDYLSYNAHLRLCTISLYVERVYLYVNWTLKESMVNLARHLEHGVDIHQRMYRDSR